jgi:hypothetical protein
MKFIYPTLCAAYFACRSSIRSSEAASQDSSAAAEERSQEPESRSQEGVGGSRDWRGAALARTPLTERYLLYDLFGRNECETGGSRE